MGMVMIGRRLSADELRAVLADPAMVDTLIYGDLDDEDGEMPDPDLDLDKSWHGLHYLLTGTAWLIGDGAGAAVLGGDSIGEDHGYGPPRLVRPEAVSAIASALDALDLDTLRARYDPIAMSEAEIYPEVWASDDEFDGYLAPYLTQLRRFYQLAAANHQAVLLAIT